MIDQAVAHAARAAADTIGRGRRNEPRLFTITKFGRHPDGYLHARVVVNGQAFYFHRQFGSWLAPGHIGNQTVLKEPEALLGPEIGRAAKFALSEKSQPFDNAARREREAREEAKRRASTTPSAPSDGRGDDAAEHPDRLPATGDQGHAADAVQPE